MLENVVLFNIFENALKKVNNRQIHTRTAKMRFDGYLVFFVRFQNVDQKDICESIVSKAESKQKHEENIFWDFFLLKPKMCFFGGPK